MHYKEEKRPFYLNATVPYLLNFSTNRINQITEQNKLNYSLKDNNRLAWK